MILFDVNLIPNFVIIMKKTSCSIMMVLKIAQVVSGVNTFGFWFST